MTGGQCCYRTCSQAVEKWVRVKTVTGCATRMVSLQARNVGTYAGEGKPNSLKEVWLVNGPSFHDFSK
jgi:hypothetical protein